MASLLAALNRLLRFLGLAGPARAAPQPPPAAARHGPEAAEDATVPPPASPARPPRAAPEVLAAAPVPPGPPPQAILAMPQLVAIAGMYPQRGGGDPAFFSQGMIEPFAGGMAAYGAPPAQGQLLPINQPINQALFSLYGTSFGGNGMNNFALPNLKGRIAVGGGQVGQMGQQTLTLTYLIAANGSEVPLPGMIVAFGGNFAPDGWLATDGSLLPISANLALFEVIGATYGGNGATDFALPNLEGAAAVGAGQGPGLPPVTLGEKIGGTVPGLGLNYLICMTGLYPSSSGNGAFPANEPYLGQVVAHAGAQAPAGWALCDGSLVPIASNPPLYSLIGTTYGGDGETDFALPDLRGRMLSGT
jgi:microcystin-dependent protein